MGDLFDQTPASQAARPERLRALAHDEGHGSVPLAY